MHRPKRDWSFPFLSFAYCPGCLQWGDEDQFSVVTEIHNDVITQVLVHLDHKIYRGDKNGLHH